MNQQNIDIQTSLKDALQLQKNKFIAKPYPSYAERIADLNSLKQLLSDNEQDIISAINADYGNRAVAETLLAEMLVVYNEIKHTKKQLKKWLKTQRRHTDWMLFPGVKNTVEPQPLGVVGVITPWNFPINLSFGPLAAIFAAGNSALVKMSENSMNLARLLNERVAQYFPPEKLQFIVETGDVGPLFSSLPFDHLLFTGSGTTGRKVMANAAKNLTPVTLELGGKSPAVVAPDYPLNQAVERIMFAKQMNAGQICTNVDYVFVGEQQLQDFIKLSQAWVAKHVPDIHADSYTAIIDDLAFNRLQETIMQAQMAGSKIVWLQQQTPCPISRKFPLVLVINPSDEDLTLCQRETFGPILTVRTYQDSQQVIDYINRHDRPLAFYPFTNDKQLVKHYIRHVMSGGVTINDALYHVAQHDLPFGGVGPSGMGHYHGKEGFMTFSKLRPICQQPRWSANKLFYPPFGSFKQSLMRKMLSITKK